MNENVTVRGFKVFNPDWTCDKGGKPFQYEVGKTYEEDVNPSVCGRGFHFCKSIIDCFDYYDFDPNNKAAEVLALGKVVTDGKKFCTNKIKIVREIPWAEVLEIVNTGKNCTGMRNSGNCNDGDYNSGDYNSGDYNSGYYNNGCFNSGNYNSGNYNVGDHNDGDYNIGDWNKCSYSNGCFNTEGQKFYMFNKPSPWSDNDWLYSEARSLMYSLKGLDNIEYNLMWWRGLDDRQKSVIMEIPNFDKEIFKEITGIDVMEE